MSTRSTSTGCRLELLPDANLESRIGHYRRVLGLFSVILAILVCSAAGMIASSGPSGGVVRDLPLIMVAVALILIAVPTVRLSRRVRSLRLSYPRVVATLGAFLVLLSH